MNVIGEVAGHTCILVDDIVDSGGTLVNAADALLEQGAKAVYAYITHGVLSGGAVARIAKSRLKELVITDSIQPTKEVLAAGNIRVLPIATPDRRSDRAHRGRRVGFEPVRLNSRHENRTDRPAESFALLASYPLPIYMCRSIGCGESASPRLPMTAQITAHCPRRCLWRAESSGL